ncbi:hypothetical protein GF407_00085 [candidate division KSB1 bacterium]|nr:hypothetical protein [candidate division KSB1 bacterium]
MEISYTSPLQNAWRRMIRALFKPFDLKVWIIVGFTAFLANLLSGPAGRGINGADDFDDGNGIEHLSSLPATVWDWLVQHPLAFFGIFFAILIAAAIFVVLAWLQARGKFMFLDNVIHQRAMVSDPWNEYRRQGHSLFGWYLIFSVLVICLVVFLVVYFFSLAGQVEPPGNDFYLLLPFFLKLIVVLLAVSLPLAFIALMVDSFIIPIMYNDKISVWQAWNRFLTLLRKEIPHFILYALLILVLKIMVGVVLFILGFLTCCVGFILLVIPYISAVVTLPISYFFRVYSVEFLQQFGKAYRIFPQE